VGLLYAAPGVGAVVGALLSGFIGRIRHQGRAVIVSAAIWGVAIAFFGLAGTLWLGMVMLAIGGAADAISAISRGVIQQTIAPDALRGRISAANSMVVVGGPYLGDLRAGSMAAAFGPRVSLVSGGLTCVIATGLLALALPGLRRYDAEAQSGLRPA
jgi:MFS family permease